MNTSRSLLVAIPVSLAATLAACGSSPPVIFGDATTSGTASTTTTTGTGGSSTGTVGTGSSTSSAPNTTTSGTQATTTTSSSSSSSSSGAFTSEGAFPKTPQVQNYGGAVPMASPKLHAIFFAGDDTATTQELGTFTTTLGATDYWKAAVSEYGVGPATGNVIQLTETAATSLSDDQVASWLVGKFTSDPTNFPAPTTEDLYVIYYPAGVSITLQGQTSCQVFGGYHNSTTYGNKPVSYAVLPRCSPFEQGQTVLQTTTASASHEIAEGTTDPTPEVAPAYAMVDETDLYWASALGGSEVGDMCAQNPQAFTTFPGFPYLVQRIWSNKAAAAGHDPCQPEPAGEVYYNVAPVLTQTVDFNYYGQTVPVRGIKIAVGQSATIPVEYYSDGAMASWPAQAYDYQSTFEGGSALLDLQMSPPTGNNGTKGTLKITVNKAGQDNQELFFIGSSTDGGATINWWFGLVQN